MIPVYHHCETWEDWKNGMMRTVSTQSDNLILENCIILLSNAENLYNAMKKVVNDWPISTEERLTKIDTNRRAWLGWAACSIMFKAPDFITRKAWGLIPKNKKADANLIAEKVILEYESRVKGAEIVCQLSLWE
jgi:hypothetical protein